MYVQTKVRGDGIIIAHLLLDPEERSGLTYRNQIRASIHCALVGTIAVAALAGPDGLSFPALAITEREELERQLSLELRPIADEAIIRARALHTQVMQREASHA